MTIILILLLTTSMFMNEPSKIYVESLQVSGSLPTVQNNLVFIEATGKPRFLSEAEVEQYLTGNLIDFNDTLEPEPECAYIPYEENNSNTELIVWRLLVSATILGLVVDRAVSQ